jgi:hypothetical protein
MTSKSWIVCIFMGLIVSLPVKTTRADEAKASVDESLVQAFISSVYKGIDFSNMERLSFDVFCKAYRGYINLRNAGKLDLDRAIITICDFDLPSSEPRMWVIDLDTRKVLFNTLVAHGQGSGEECASMFSNQENSHQSSLGYYVTGETYNGDHGSSLRLNGMDAGFNDAAFDRGIVVHGANYVSERYIRENERLGRSWGCPAVPEELKMKIIATIQGATCLYIHHTDDKFNRASYWLNKRVEHLPVLGDIANFTLPAKAPKGIKYIIHYKDVHHRDSVKEFFVAEPAKQ